MKHTRRASRPATAHFSGARLSIPLVGLLLIVGATPQSAPSGEAASVARTASPLDDFKCYRTRETGFPRFHGRSVTLVDQFGPTSARVLRPARLCNAADMNGRAPTIRPRT